MKFSPQNPFPENIFFLRRPVKNSFLFEEVFPKFSFLFFLWGGLPRIFSQGGTPKFFCNISLFKKVPEFFSFSKEVPDVFSQRGAVWNFFPWRVAFKNFFLREWPSNFFFPGEGPPNFFLDFLQSFHQIINGCPLSPCKSILCQFLCLLRVLWKYVSNSFCGDILNIWKTKEVEPSTLLTNQLTKSDGLTCPGLWYTV